jgi:ubiquitin-protein ligase E3 A
MMICGSPKLEFKDLERATIYADGYTKDTPVIKWFWEVIHSLTEDQKKKFLCFCTGADRAPINGLSKLKFIIARNGGDTER